VPGGAGTVRAIPCGHAGVTLGSRTTSRVKVHISHLDGSGAASVAQAQPGLQSKLLPSAGKGSAAVWGITTAGLLSGTAPAPSGSGITVTSLARATVPAVVFVAWLVATGATVRVAEPSPGNCPF
jgi:hypothetical protein